MVPDMNPPPGAAAFLARHDWAEANIRAAGRRCVLPPLFPRPGGIAIGDADGRAAAAGGSQALHRDRRLAHRAWLRCARDPGRGARRGVWCCSRISAMRGCARRSMPRRRASTASMPRRSTCWSRFAPRAAADLPFYDRGDLSARGGAAARMVLPRAGSGRGCRGLCRRLGCGAGAGARRQRPGDRAARLSRRKHHAGRRPRGAGPARFPGRAGRASGL